MTTPLSITLALATLCGVMSTPTPEVIPIASSECNPIGDWDFIVVGGTTAAVSLSYMLIDGTCLGELPGCQQPDAPCCRRCTSSSCLACVGEVWACTTPVTNPDPNVPCPGCADLIIVSWD